MKVRGLLNKIARLNPNSINFNMKDLAKLKEGGIVELSKDNAESLINMGMVEIVKTSKSKGDK